MSFRKPEELFQFSGGKKKGSPTTPWSQMFRGCWSCQAGSATATRQKRDIRKFVLPLKKSLKKQEEMHCGNSSAFVGEWSRGGRRKPLLLAQMLPGCFPSPCSLSLPKELGLEVLSRRVLPAPQPTSSSCSSYKSFKPLPYLFSYQINDGDLLPDSKAGLP